MKPVLAAILALVMASAVTVEAQAVEKRKARPASRPAGHFGQLQDLAQHRASQGRRPGPHPAASHGSVSEHHEPDPFSPTPAKERSTLAPWLAGRHGRRAGRGLAGAGDHAVGPRIQLVIRVELGLHPPRRRQGRRSVRACGAASNSGHMTEQECERRRVAPAGLFAQKIGLVPEENGQGVKVAPPRLKISASVCRARPWAQRFFRTCRFTSIRTNGRIGAGAALKNEAGPCENWRRWPSARRPSANTDAPRALSRPSRHWQARPRHSWRQNGRHSAFRMQPDQCRVTNQDALIRNVGDLPLGRLAKTCLLDSEGNFGKSQKHLGFGHERAWIGKPKWLPPA